MSKNNRVRTNELDRDLLRKKRNKKIVELIVVIVFGIFLLVGGSYAWLKLSIDGSKTSNIKAGTLSLNLDESSSEGISLENAYPITNDEGLKTTQYKFTIKNTGDIASKYTLYLDDQEIENTAIRMADKYVKFHLTKNNKIENEKMALLTSIGENPNRILDTDTLEPNGINSYTLQVWMDYAADNDAQNTVFSSKLKIEATQVIK